MKKISAVLAALPICLLTTSLYAAQKDAAGCKDHPLLPRTPGYFIVACAENEANFDYVTLQGTPPETIHVEGKSRAIAYSTQPELKAKPSREQILNNTESTINKIGGSRIGMVNTTPVYKLADGGKEYLVMVLADNIGGGFAYRIIDKADMVQAKKPEPKDNGLNCEQYGPPFFPPIPGYEICGCGGQDSSSRDVKIVQAPGTIHIQGKLTQMTYCAQDERSKQGETQIRRNFENDIKKQGGTFVGKSVKKPGIDVYKLTKDGKENWIEVWTEASGDYNYVVTR